MNQKLQQIEPAQAAQMGMVPPVEWHGERKGCKVNIYVKARLAWFKQEGQPMYQGLLVTTNGDIHNPWLFVGQTVPFTVDILVDGVVTDGVSYDLYAPAVLDPAGSDKWYGPFKHEANVDPDVLDDLNRISLEISV